MTEETKMMLNDEIAKEFEDLSKMSLDDERKANGIDNVVKLCKLQIEASKIDDEKQSKDLEAIEKKKERVINIITKSAELLVPIAAYGVWLILCLDFEENGSIRSTSFRNLISNFRPTKRK